MAELADDAATVRARALSFGSVAELYERYRPGYPEAVVDAVVGHARRPVRTALEVGAGTGKATRVFAARGIEVVALEPDPAMAEVLRATTRGRPVRPVPTTFEGFRTDDRFDVLYAAAAWHWTDPRTRWTHAAELLAPGGVLALFGGAPDLVDPDLLAAVDEVERRVRPGGGAVGHAWSVEDVAAVGELTDVVRVELPGVVTRTADQFVGRLATVSAYLLLAPEARADALRRVRAVLPDHVEVDVTVRLTLARRR